MRPGLPAYALFGLAALLMSGCESSTPAAKATPAAGRAQNVPVTYVSFDNETLQRYAWSGRHVALLARKTDLDADAMQTLLDGLDAAYEAYFDATERFPEPFKTYESLLTIADVPSTCGVGCGVVGSTGIELRSDFFDRLYAGVLKRGEFDQLPFYELGRNFWYYSAQAEYVPNTLDSIVTGYAVLYRHVSLARTGLAPGPVLLAAGDIPWPVFDQTLRGLADTYISGATYNWFTTSALNMGVPNDIGLGATDLFASIMLHTADLYGGDDFLIRFPRELGHRPARTTTLDALDNLVLAACAASGQNLVPYFITTIKWPVSPAAQAEAATTYGTPAGTIGSTEPD